jgi:hypothetical protein
VAVLLNFLHNNLFNGQVHLSNGPCKLILFCIFSTSFYLKLNCMKKYCLLLPFIMIFSSAIVAQNVGIGTSSPIYKLDINGSLHASNNAFIDGFVGIGTTLPSNKLQVNNGAISLLNTGDSKSWQLNYTSPGKYFYIAEDGIPRMTLANGGNVGIGNSSPQANLDVAGTGNFSGSVTVSNNKGLLTNAAGNTQLRYYTRQATFTAILPAFGTSVEGSIGFSGFTSAPQVFVGDIVSTGGTVGELYRVQLVVYDVTASGCHCRLINTSSQAVNYGITWNIICIGN